MYETSHPPSPAWLLKSPDPPADPSATSILAAHLACPAAVAEILVARGITSSTAAESFLNPTLAAFLEDPANDPTQLLGMAPAVTRILHAIQHEERILIYGDYDVDGTTATVLLKTTIERIALAINPSRPAAVTYHVPHRIREGYGMQTSVLALASASGIRLVISVDTGIRALAEADEARRLALDLIVTDHHLPYSDSEAEVARIPDCLAVINPAQPHCPYPNKSLCGAAVAFKLAHALLLAAAPLTQNAPAFLSRTNRILVPSFLKLVAIATIADSVPLTGENRTLVALGLAALAKPIQPGLRALMQIANIPPNRAPTATEVGFRLAPRINAAGRMDIASDVVELFLTRDPLLAQSLAEKLDRLNTDRRASEAAALDAIDRELLTLLGPDGTYPADCIILDHPDWHRGVLGILASRVVDRTGRPALILTHSQADGDAHGSGRSIPGFHLLDALTAVHTANIAGDPESSLSRPKNPTSETRVLPSQDLADRSTDTPVFHRFGGHAHAVGFSLPADRLPLLRARMTSHAAPLLAALLLIPSILYDAELAVADITLDLFSWIARCGPFGIGNPEPIFLTRSAVLAAAVRRIKEKHVCLQFAHPGLTSDYPLSALGWSRGLIDWPARCTHLALTRGSAIDILYRLKQNTGPHANGPFAGLELELCALRPAVEPLSLAAAPDSPA